MSALLTCLLMICAATTFAAALVVAQRRLVAGVVRRFARLPRVEQALLVVAVCVTTVCAQKSGVEKVEVEGGGGERANVFNAEKGESQRRGEVADQNGRAESMTPPDEDDETSSVGRVIDATLPQANLSSATSVPSLLRAKTFLATNEVFDFSPPEGACIATNWLKRGAVTDFRSIRISGAFPFDGVDHSRLLVSASGEILLFPSRTKLKPFAAPLGIVPEANWGEKASQFWHRQLDDGTLLLTWQNALLNRAAESPVSIQAELSPSGDITYRYDLSRLASDDLLTNVVVAAGTNLCTSVTNRAVTSWTLRSANSLRCDAGAADFAARRGDADLWACPPSSTNTVYEHLFYTGTTNAPFAYPTATSGTAILRVTVSGSGSGALLVGDRCVVLNAEEEVSNAEEEETGSRGDEEDGSASPSLSNLRAKNTTLLVPVTRGKTQKLFLRGDATLSVSLDSDDFAFGESPSITAHRLNGWINFPLTVPATACFHGWNKPTRRVTLATGEDAEELTCAWIASKDVAVSNVPPRSAVFTKVGSPRTSPSVAYDLSHPLHLFGATRFEQTTRHCPPLPEIDAADGWWESGAGDASGAEGCRCCVWGTCPEDCSCGCSCNAEAGRTPNTAEPDDYALSKTNCPHLTGVLKIRDPLVYSDTLALDVPGGVRNCCPCPGHATNDVSLAFRSRCLKVVGEDGQDFVRSAESTSVRVAAVSPSREPGDAIVCFATNGTVSLSKGYTTLGVGIRKGRLDIAAFNRYNSSFGIPVPVGTNGLSLTRIDLVTKVGLDGGNVHLGFDETTTADFMILFWDSDAGAFRQLCRTGTDLDISLEDWKSLVGASSDAESAKTPVYVAALGNGSARLVFRYWGVFGGEFVEDEAKQRFTSVDSPIRADVDHDGMIDAADEALSREGRPFRFWLNEDTAKGDYVGQVADDSPNASDLKVNGKLDLVNLFPVEIDLSRFWSEWGMMASVKISSPAGGLRYCVLGGAVASNVWSLATTPLLTKNGEALEAAALTRLTGDGMFPWGDAGLRGRPFVLAFEASERVASGTCLNVTLLFDGEEISTFRLPLSVSSVDDMYRYADLRGAIGNASFVPAVPGEPLNGPDAETDGRHFVFVHGYNVDAASSRRWARAMFKRLWWAGSRSKFTAVDWRGDDSQISVPTQGDISPNYYVNVKNAFLTAPALASLCGRLPGEKVMLGHSLGSMLVSSAAVDHNLDYSKYYMLNAAVPMEAYDRTAADDLMVDGAWSDVDELFRASRFANLFAETPSDFRACLSWRGRFAGIRNAVNCYSPTEEVLTNPATNKVFGVESSNFGGAWSKQELFKGCALWYGVNAVTFSGTEIEGGWGINAAYTANPLAYVPLVGLRPGYFEDRTREDMITDPLFTSFDDERMASTNVLAIVDDELRAKMLGDAIPAESFAAGANATGGVSKNHNLHDDMEKTWPKVKGGKTSVWEHSDIKNVAYFYLHKLFKKISNGEL